MTNKELAKHTLAAFNLLTKATSDRATRGSTKAAMDLLGQMSAMNLVLRGLGYATNDTGKLIRYKPSKDSLEVKLAKLAAGGDTDAAIQLLTLFSTNIQ